MTDISRFGCHGSIAAFDFMSQVPSSSFLVQAHAPWLCRHEFPRVANRAEQIQKSLKPSIRLVSGVSVCGRTVLSCAVGHNRIISGSTFDH